MSLICIACNKELPLAMFSKKNNTKRGYHYKCKPCHNEYVRTKWYPANKEKQKASSKRWKEQNKVKVVAARYNASEDDVIKVLMTDSCEICGSDSNLVVDHDHSTEKLRGRLCSHCNFAIGLFKDDIDRLQSAVVYLQKHTGVSSNG